MFLQFFFRTKMTTYSSSSVTENELASSTRRIFIVLFWRSLGPLPTVPQAYIRPSTKVFGDLISWSIRFSKTLVSTWKKSCWKQCTNLRGRKGAVRELETWTELSCFTAKISHFYIILNSIAKYNQELCKFKNILLIEQL